MASLDRLPDEILTEITQGIGVVDVLCLRLVSKNMKQKIDNTPQLIREFIRRKLPLTFYGRCLINLTYHHERYAEALIAAGRDPEALSEELQRLRDRLAKADKLIVKLKWDKVLLQVCRQQLAIETHSYSKKVLYFTDLKRLVYSPVIPWGVGGMRSHHDKYADPPWAYDKTFGCLVYFDRVKHVYLAVDLQTKATLVIPFAPRHRIIRRVRSSQGVLVIEWADLNSKYIAPGDHLHRHFATIFDFRLRQLADDEPGPVPEDTTKTLQPTPPGDPRLRWSVTHRFCWPIADDGFDIETEGGDFYFTAHNQTHVSTPPLPYPEIAPLIHSGRFLTVLMIQYVVYACTKRRGKKPGDNDIIEKTTVYDIRRKQGRTAPTIVKTLNTGNLVGTSLDPDPRVRGHPRFLRLDIDRVTIDPDTDEPIGHVFYHLEQRTIKNHRVSCIGLALDNNDESFKEECKHPCTEIDPLDPRNDDPLEPDLASDYPGRVQHWRVREGRDGSLSQGEESARMYSHAAGVAFIGIWKRSHSGLAFRTTFHRVVKPAAVKIETHDYDMYGNVICTRRETDYRWGRHRDAFGLYGYRSSYDFGGRFYITGDERWIIGEDEDGHIEVFIF